MSLAVDHIECANCGGTLALPDGRHTITCDGCGTRNLIQDEHVVPHRFVRPLVSKGAARAAAERRMACPETRPDTLVKASFLAPVLCYVPFIEYTATEVGHTVSSKGEKKVRKARREVVDGRIRFVDMDGNEIHEHDYYAAFEIVDDRDTHIRIGDRYEAGPACRVPAFGLDRVDLRALRQRKDFPGLTPYEPSLCDEEGRFFDVTRDHRAFIEEREAARRAMHEKVGFVEDERHLVEPRVQIVYLPVWSMRVLYSGRQFHVAVCGTTGDILEGRAPARSSSGVLFLLLAAAMVALPAGRFVAFVGESPEARAAALQSGSVLFAMLFHPVGLVVGLTFALLALIAILTVMGLAWRDLRYAGEVVFDGPETKIVHPSAPAETLFDKGLNAALSVAGRFMRSIGESIEKQRGRES